MTGLHSEATRVVSLAGVFSDADGDGKINVSEYQQAFSDYIAGKITYEEMLEVSNAYARQGSG